MNDFPESTLQAHEELVPAPALTPGSLTNGATYLAGFINPGQISFQGPAGITGNASVQLISNGVTTNTVNAAAATNSPVSSPLTINSNPPGQLVLPIQH